MKNDFLLSLAAKYDSPLYVYDADKMEQQYGRLRTAFSGVEKLRLNYAMKSLSNISVLKFFKKLGSGLDTVSIQEVQLGLRAGFAPGDIIFTPNGVGLEELGEAVKLGVQINIDNLSILELFGQQYPDVPVCVRINPHVMAGGNRKISVGHIDSKFGISIHQLPLIERVVENTQMVINGIHMHTGSDILDIDTFLLAADILLRAARSFPDLEFVDLGSGFKVPYQKGGNATNVKELGIQLAKRFNEFCESYGRELTLMFEPGKFLVSEAGKFLVKVNVIKQTTSTVFAGVNSGFNHLIRPMFYDSYHHITNISNPEGRIRFYSVVGYICETDTFASNRQIAEISEGDILCFDNAGAYCFTMASNFNSRYKPAEVLVYKGTDYLIRERDVFEDIMSKQIEIEL